MSLSAMVPIRRASIPIPSGHSFRINQTRTSAGGMAQPPLKKRMQCQIIIIQGQNLRYPISVPRATAETGPFAGFRNALNFSYQKLLFEACPAGGLMYVTSVLFGGRPLYIFLIFHEHATCQVYLNPVIGQARALQLF